MPGTRKDILKNEYVNDDPELVRHSEEIRDIITTVPSALIRRSMLLFCLVFLMIVGLATFIRFPNMVSTTVKLTDTSVGELSIKQFDLQKIHPGQRVIIKLKSLMNNTNGIIEGHIAEISPSLNKSGDFTATTIIDTQHLNKHLKLIKGMVGDAQIVTENVSILKRISSNLLHKRLN